MAIPKYQFRYEVVTPINLDGSQGQSAFYLVLLMHTKERGFKNNYYEENNLKDLLNCKIEDPISFLPYLFSNVGVNLAEDIINEGYYYAQDQKVELNADIVASINSLIYEV